MSAPAEPSVTDVEAAAERIVDAFAANDGPRYFAGFAPEATFIFHPEPQRLASRDAYEQLWNSWRADGWRVVSCASTDPHVQTFAGGAVFSHTVHTAVETPQGPESYRERETIVFALQDGRLLAVHEHLSAHDA
ncbi:nuclear transport factor 2 family protein [Nesterenkonia sp. NBAIMH1]|uniref:YybH family protein n=1 Tax=Nesterenkonia sp. NBAIMH1 TaxID=2600320 RepID=UPI0011B7ABEA|nr:nuclear transport factor 2 family protein [Nesterenkonia sp. NBAIMH1]